MRLSQWLIVILLVSGLITGMATFYGDLFDTYGSSADDVSDMSKSSETLDHASELSEQTQDINFDGILYIFMAPFKVVKMVFSSVGVVKGMFTDMFAFMGLPAWAFNILMGVVLISIVFAVVSAYIKWRV